VGDGGTVKGFPAFVVGPKKRPQLFEGRAGRGLPGGQFTFTRTSGFSGAGAEKLVNPPASDGGDFPLPVTVASPAIR